MEKMLTDNPVQDFKYCFEQWWKLLERCKESPSRHLLSSPPYPLSNGSGLEFCPYEHHSLHGPKGKNEVVPNKDS
jgi:hypothetical protein